MVAVIPARGGSKRIPRKALADVGGTSLLERTVGQALRLRSIALVVVSTEDPRVRRAALAAGAEVLLRPRRLATDAASSLAVLRHAIRALNLPPRATVVLLQVTSPLRADADVEAALRRFRRGDADAVVTVTEAHPPPHWMFRPKGGRLGPVVAGPGPALLLNGAVYVSSAGHLLRRGFTDGRCAFLRMPRERSVDVDTPLDLRIARMLAP